MHRLFHLQEEWFGVVTALQQNDITVGAGESRGAGAKLFAREAFMRASHDVVRIF